MQEKSGTVNYRISQVNLQKLADKSNNKLLRSKSRQQHVLYCTAKYRVIQE
jgi:hypothetical protein